jgi:exonuclease SbcD
MSEKKPLVVGSTDWHIKDDNADIVFDLVKQQCELAKELKVDNLMCLGDVFNSRKSQTLKVLNTFRRILDMIDDYNLKLIVIPGNHDKTVYENKESFLDSFRHYPAIFLIDNIGEIPLTDELNLHFMPFFKEEVWEENFNTYINKYLKSVHGEELKGINIFCSHIAITGSRNNDGKRVESNISHKSFRHFDKVLLGHYHDSQKIGKNIYHIPSIQQNNFGEDEDKGFTVLYSDGSHETVNSKFKPYIKVKIDLDEVDKKELNKMIEEHSKETDSKNVRFVLSGSEDKLKSINKELIRSVGIDVKTENKDVEIVEEFDDIEIKRYDEASILDEFKMFCEEFDKDYKEGIKYLKV